MKRLSLVIAFLSLTLSTSASAKPTSAQLIQGTRAFAKLWREASLPQHRASPEDVIARYQRVIDTSAYLESPFKRWYLAVTHFGLARTYARLELIDSARTHLQQAAEHDFWNFDVMYADPILRSCVGIIYLDSLASAFSDRRSAERKHWRAQIPIVHGPNEGTIWRQMGNIDSWFTDSERRANTLDSIYTVRWEEMIAAARSKEKPKVIIALHGGNASYREFGSNWAMIGQMTHSYVITPPGIVRYSKLMNSWDAEYELIDEYLMSIVDQLRDKDGELPPIYLAGYSQGACISLKFGLVHPETVKGVIAFAGFMDAPLNDEVLATTKANGLKVYAISGEFDSENFKNSLRQVKREFDSVGAEFTFVEEKQMIHELPQPFPLHFAKAWRQVTR